MKRIERSQPPRPAAVRPEESAVPSGELRVVPLESMTVNLADPERRAYLRTTLQLGLGGAAKKDEKEKKEEAMTPAQVAAARDAILAVLTAQRSDDLATAEGRQKLKETLKRSLREHVGGLDVEEVYVTDLLVQQ